MSFQNLTHSINDNKPVKETASEKVVYCGNFTGELSSVTGIYSKFLYIARIDILSGEARNPTVRILCGSECKDHCINLTKKYRKDGKIT